MEKELEQHNGTQALPSNRRPAARLFRLFVLAGLTALLIGLCALVCYPYLPAIAWGVALAIIAWPLHTWIQRHIRNPDLAAAASTAVVLAVILGPILLAAYQLAQEAATVAAEAPKDPESLQEKAAEIPWVGLALNWMEQVGLNVTEQVRKAVEAITPVLPSLAQVSVATVIQTLVAICILFFLLRDHHLFLRGLKDLLPLSEEDGDRILQSAADSVYGNVYATVATSAIDALGGGLMFWLLGLPSPVLWGLIIFILSVLPILGSAIVWVPAALYLALSGQFGSALALVAWGLATWALVDNLFYVRLVGQRMQMHPLPALISFLGGISVFGVSGMVLGPTILAVTLAVLDYWKRRPA